MGKHKASEEPGDGFWDWSNAVYRRPGVADRLLALQDSADLNVNLILWCAWIGLERGAVKAKAVRKAASASADWSSAVVAPLRAARKALKSAPDEADGSEALRKAVKNAELDAERIEQSMLERMAPEDIEGEPGAAAALANLIAYRDAMSSRAPDDAFDGLVGCLAATDADDE